MDPKVWLKKNKLTQAQFAKMITISPSALNNYLTKKRVPILEIVARVEKATKGQVRMEDWLKFCKEKHGKTD